MKPILQDKYAYLGTGVCFAIDVVIRCSSGNPEGVVSNPSQRMTGYPLLEILTHKNRAKIPEE